MAYQHWFVSRQKRQLTTILDALVAFNDLCIGEKWSGNHELQTKLEDTLQDRQITKHGGLRARKENAGGGGVRTLYKQMKDLGLVFAEDDNKKARLTLIGEDLVKGDISLVEAMRIQLGRYQYPSASSWSGSGSVDHSFRVHPFHFILRLLRDPDLNNVLTMEEMEGIVIHYAKSDSDACFSDVKTRIMKVRAGDKSDLIPDTKTKTYANIANTFFNYISMMQFTDRGPMTLSVRTGKEQAVDTFLASKPVFIPHPELQENYQRKYGRGRASKDLRDFSKETKFSRIEIIERRIRSEYALIKLETPITVITPDIVEKISNKTGVAVGKVESVLVSAFPNGSVDDFFLNYRELAHGGTKTAKLFEIATCELFRKIFKMRAEHVGPLGNTPDVFVESKEENWCGIIDNKAYKQGYSIIGDHKRRMIDVYIPNYRAYGCTEAPLVFFTYIAPSFGKSINSQIAAITSETGIEGSAIPVDLMINFAQDYAHGEYNHEKIKQVFSVGREIELADIME